ncbi:MAG: isoleucine--tRNA ligase [Clostridia bacterium]|nr:isoleucine--tRNA ligase [Clostridia bacterium]
MSEEKQDYGKTLNLPSTEFPMRGNLPENEPKVQNAILENGLYEKMIKKNEGHKTYVLHDGPPYANGEIHMGHALNKVLKDAVNRFKSLQGYQINYIPGYDTHGLPTEKKAIQALGINRDEISISKFRDICRDFATQYIDKQAEGFKRLGVLGDWEHPYATLQPEFEARQIGVFGDMYQKGYIYKGLKPVYWCTDCETALAEAEIEYQDVDNVSIYVKFPVAEGKGVLDTDTKIVIWTTTPWTLPGNTGITVGGEFEYSVVDTGKEKLVMATELVEKVMQTAKIENYKIVKTMQGASLEGILCNHPFMQDRISRVVIGSDDTVAVELGTGTGAVHTAPGYGKEDYLCGLKNRLEIYVCVDGKGYQTEKAGPFAGLSCENSNKEITKWLEENGYLLATEKINHSYPHCWRCKNPIIIRATDQWFASVDGFKEDTLKAIETVKWTPTWGKERIASMVRDRNDWCISRQRTWGVPIPVFYCKECGTEYATKESFEKVSEIFRQKGSNAWFDLDEKELMPEGATCLKCGHHEFKKETDIMDVWFDSGSSHQGVLAERGINVPADLYLEGHDQYRGWFQSSILTSVATKGISPYKNILTHGWVIDEEGKKMSKSAGNGISPQDIIKEYGADILRLWVLSSDFKSDVSISRDILKQISESYRKMRNTARYILGNTSDYDPENPVEYKDMEEIDKWALLKLNKLLKNSIQNYEDFNFHIVYHDINQFCVTDMSNFYLDIIKDRLYTSKKNSIERRSSQTAMYIILNTLVKLLAPMICYTAEEIWKYMPHTKEEQVESVMLSTLPEPNEVYENKELEEKWNHIIELKEQVAKELEVARANKTIGHSLNAKVILTANGKEYEFLKENRELLETVFIVSDLQIEESTEKKLDIKVEVAQGEKCERCWKYDKTVGQDKEHSSLCHKCSTVISNT